MAGQAFIHIGVSRTGTTSIQKAMALAADRLRREHSINYPDAHANHWAIALPFLGGQDYQPRENRIRRGHGNEREAEAGARRLLRGLRRDAARYRTHVISAEQLQLLDVAAVDRLKAFFDGLGLATRVIVYVRHPAERLSSLMAQRLRSGGVGLRDFPVNDTVTPVVKTWAHVFGKENTIVRRFGQNYLINGSIVDDFTAAFHGSPIVGMPQTRLNESISTPAVLIADRLFEIAPLASGRRHADEWLFQIAGPKFLAPRALVTKAVEEGRAGLEWLATEFGVRFDDVDLNRFPETIATEFTPETLLSLAEILNSRSPRMGRRRGLVARSLGALMPGR